MEGSAMLKSNFEKNAAKGGRRLKAGIVYTATTPGSVKAIEAELHKQFGGSLEIASYQDKTILDEVCEQGAVTAPAAARLVSLFMQAVADGVDGVLCCCSSVGAVADASQSLAQLMGVPIVRIDEEMCREAVRLGGRIGILATLPSTLEPTRNTVLRMADEMGRQVLLVDGLMENAFGMGPEAFEKAACQKAAELIDQVDVLLLAQASMAGAEGPLAKRFQKPVLSSPRFGAAALKRALEQRSGDSASLKEKSRPAELE